MKKLLTTVIVLLVLAQPMIWFFVYTRFDGYAIAHKAVDGFTAVCIFSCFFFMVVGFITVLKSEELQ